jgi:predicted nucleic acid-binding protein
VRLYVDTSVLAACTYFSETETTRFETVNQLLNTCIKNEIEIVVSFYSLHELFLLAFEYLDEKSEEVGLESVRTIVNMPIRLVPLLSREKRILYHKRFKMKDRTDVPHAITAFVCDCDYIITYDNHFKEISDQISVATPEEVVEML